MGKFIQENSSGARCVVDRLLPMEAPPIVEGVENVEMSWDEERFELVKARVPRLEEMGLFVPRKELHDADVFRVYEFPGWAICTDRLKGFIEAAGFANVDFFEIGELS